MWEEEKKEGKDKWKREREKKGGGGTDDVMRFIVRAGDRVSRANTQTSHFVFFLSFHSLSESEQQRGPLKVQQMWQTGLIWHPGGREEEGRGTTRAKIPHRVFIKARLMWSQQQRRPLNLGSPAYKAWIIISGGDQVGHVEARSLSFK